MRSERPASAERSGTCITGLGRPRRGRSSGSSTATGPSANQTARLQRVGGASGRSGLHEPDERVDDSRAGMVERGITPVVNTFHEVPLTRPALTLAATWSAATSASISPSDGVDDVGGACCKWSEPLDTELCGGDLQERRPVQLREHVAGDAEQPGLPIADKVAVESWRHLGFTLLRAAAGSRLGSRSIAG